MFSQDPNLSLHCFPLSPSQLILPVEIGFISSRYLPFCLTVLFFMHLGRISDQCSAYIAFNIYVCYLCLLFTFVAFSELFQSKEWQNPRNCAMGSRDWR